MTLPQEEGRNPLLAPYRNRGGDIRDETGRRGVVFVSTDVWSSVQRAWRRPRRVDPQESPHLWIALEADWFKDYVLPSEDVPALCEDWARGRLGTFNDITFTVEWRDEPGSAEIGAEFGF